MLPSASTHAVATRWPRDVADSDANDLSSNGDDDTHPKMPPCALIIARPAW
jgi:hypothetical protein